jgi:hypothetical protein
MAPRLVVRSPKSLAVTLAGSKVVGHIVVLTCKFVGENRSHPNIKETKKQVCEKWTLTAMRGPRP